MRPDDAIDDEGAGGEGETEAAREKVIVRSNGVVTYIGKDLANQFWKLGLLGRDFHYRRFAVQAGGHALWATTSDGGEPDALKLVATKGERLTMWFYGNI